MNAQDEQVLLGRRARLGLASASGRRRHLSQGLELSKVEDILFQPQAQTLIPEVRTQRDDQFRGGLLLPGGAQSVEHRRLGGAEVRGQALLDLETLRGQASVLETALVQVLFKHEPVLVELDGADGGIVGHDGAGAQDLAGLQVQHDEKQPVLVLMRPHELPFQSANVVEQARDLPDRLLDLVAAHLERQFRLAAVAARLLHEQLDLVFHR